MKKNEGNFSYNKDSIPITILTTNDLHSHVEGSGPDSYLNFNDPHKDPVKGHYARLTKQIQIIKNKKKKEDEAVLLFDIGDFSSGTLFHTLSISKDSTLSPEMDFFKTNGYDAITLGNHEFDAGEEGLRTMLNKGSKMDFKLNIVSSNLKITKKGSPLEEFVNTKINSNNNFKIIPSLILNTNSKGKKLVVGILGASGPDAAITSKYSRTHTSFVGFQDYFLRKNMKSLTDHLNKQLFHMKKKYNPDLTILLYHGGNPEDLYISEHLKDINLILSAHTHKTYFLKNNGVYISQSGCYGEKIGRIELEILNKKVNARKNSSHYISINSTIQADQEYLDKIDEYKSELRNHDKLSGFDYETILGFIDKDYERKKSLSEPLGRFITTGILTALNSEISNSVDVYFGNIGAVRSGIPLIFKKPTLFQYSDVYRMLALGFDCNLQSGSRISGFYLTQQDLKRFVEFSEFATRMHKEFKALFSENLTYSINNHGLPMINRIKNLKLNGKPIESYNRLIFFATNEILGQYIPSIHSLTRGFIKIKMRENNGMEIKKAPIISNTKEHVLFSKYIQNLQTGKYKGSENLNHPIEDGLLIKEEDQFNEFFSG